MSGKKLNLKKVVDLSVADLMAISINPKYIKSIMGKEHSDVLLNGIRFMLKEKLSKLLVNEEG